MNIHFGFSYIGLIFLLMLMFIRINVSVKQNTPILVDDLMR